MGQLGLQCREFRLQRGQQARFVVASAVELLFQSSLHLRIGDLLLARGNEGCNAPLQLRVLIHRQRAVANEGAAGKDLLSHPQQHLSCVLLADPRHRSGSTGIGAGEVAHGRIGPRRIAAQGDGLPFVSHKIHLAAHGPACPRGKPMLVRQRAAITGIDAVEHHPQKVAPCGLARLIGGVNTVETRLQRQGVVLQFSESGVHFPNLHPRHLLSMAYYI